MSRLFYVIITALFMLLVVQLLATNHMNLLTTMSGEFAGASLGRSMCSIDFNGDGIQDLVALEKNWNPDGALDFSYGMFGRIHFYWGGTGFDNQSDFAIPGSYQLQYGLGRVINAGDINNDGIEDLCYWGSEQSQEKICIFYGRENPIATPDFTLTFPHSSIYGWGFVFPLGDINNDNHADIGYVPVNSNSLSASIRVLDGATLTSTEILSTIWGTPGSSISGVGDVNDDGIADFHISHAFVSGDNTHSSLSLYYGSSSYPVCDSLILSPDTNSLISPQACPMGDVNGDGIDDFCSFMNWSGGKLWLGSPNLSSQWNVVIDDIFTSSDGYNLIHGDLNNDGCDDFMGTNYHYGGDDGTAYVWMGGTNLNGTVDLTIPFTNGVAEQFGWAKAAGDFNNDGYCDFAISQPFAQPAPLATPGRIFIYLGNAQLADTTVAVEDEISPAINESQWDINIYPNPLSKDSNVFKIEFTGDGYKEANNLDVELYNLKGQKLEAYLVNQITEGKTTWERTLNFSSAGVYIVKICLCKNTLITKSFTVK